MRKITKTIVNKYENFNNPTNEELIYLYCIYNIYNSIGKRLPNTDMANFWCLSRKMSLENTLYGRKIDFYEYQNEDVAYAYIKEFELINKDKEEYDSKN